MFGVDEEPGALIDVNGESAVAGAADSEDGGLSDGAYPSERGAAFLRDPTEERGPAVGQKITATEQEQRQPREQRWEEVEDRPAERLQLRGKRGLRRVCKMACTSALRF